MINYLDYHCIVKKIAKAVKRGNFRTQGTNSLFFVCEQTKYLYNLRPSITKMNTDYCKCFFRIELINLFFTRVFIAELI